MEKLVFEVPRYTCSLFDCVGGEKTTFWNDFTIADKFGDKSVADTFKRVFEEWKDNYIYLTELALVMNWKSWEWHEKGNGERSKFYANAYYLVDNYALENLKDDERKYYLETTD